MTDKVAYIIETPRLGLRNWLEDDLNAFTLMNKDEDVMRFFPQLLSKEQSWQMIERQQELFASKGYCFFAADILNSREFIGFIGLSEARFKASSRR